MIDPIVFPAEEIPETIGTYRIVRRLPQVGPAVVYIATRDGPHGLSREVELKLLPDTTDGSAEAAEELAREAAICGRINHPAVVRVFDFFEHDGKLVLVMERVQGIALSDLIVRLAEEHKKLGDPAIYYIGARVAGAIAVAHAATDDEGQPMPIVHRNLSPENIIVSVDGEVRLTGFGIGKIVGRTPDTAIGRIKGTPGFMAPEQARGEPVTPKADVYGLGLLLWSLLAGRRPPTDGTWPRRISGLRTDLPREVAAVVDAALDHFPGTRRISAREIEQWLSKAGSPAKGKAELKEHVTALRNSAIPGEDRLSGEGARVSGGSPSGAEHAAAPNPFQGVRFGAPEEAASPRPSARRAAEPRQTPSGAAPSHRPEEPPAAEEPPPAPRFGAPPAHAAPVESASRSAHLLSRATMRFGDIGPAPPPEPAPEPAPAKERAVPAPSIPAPPPPSLSAGSQTYAPPSPATPARAKLPRSSLLGMPSAAVPGRVPEPEPAPAEHLAPQPGPSRRAPTVLGLGSTALTIAVSAATAMVVAIVYVAATHRSGGPEPATSASAATTSSAATPASAAPKPPPPPPTATATVAPSAKPAASTSDTTGADPADLPFGYGYLTVTSPANANVYLSGKIAGPVNQALKVRCGRWFIRLANPATTRFPEWVSPGETVVVTCQATTKIDMAPKD